MATATIVKNIGTNIPSSIPRCSSANTTKIIPTKYNNIDIDINAALMIEENGLLRYFQAYIKYDYFKRKFLKTSPTWEEALYKAKEDKFSPADVNQLFQILKQDIPSCL